MCIRVLLNPLLIYLCFSYCLRHIFKYSYLKNITFVVSIFPDVLFAFFISDVEISNFLKPKLSPTFGISSIVLSYLKSSPRQRFNTYSHFLLLFSH